MANENQRATARVWPFIVRVSDRPSDSGIRCKFLHVSGHPLTGLASSIEPFVCCGQAGHSNRDARYCVRYLEDEIRLWRGAKVGPLRDRGPNTAAVIVTRCNKASAVG
jgi:hypothetical protein